MKIICFIDSLGAGGAQRQMVELAKGFKEKGHDVEIVIYHNIVFYKSILDKDGIKINLINPQNRLKRLIKIRGFIRASNADAIISFLQIPNTISILSGFPFRKWKIIVGERSADPQILTSFRRRILRWLYVFSDFIITNSYANLHMVQKINPCIKEKKCKVIYNIVNQEFEGRAVHEGTFKSNKFHLCVAASHRYVKNSRGLVEALALLDPKLLNELQVSWYGRKDDDSSYAEVKKLTAEYRLGETIMFYDPIDNISDAFARADAIGLFSFHEGLPNTVCEAMALGKPVIASKISDVSILLGHNEDVLFDPNSSTDIANAIEYLLSLSRKDLQKLGDENRGRAKMLLNRGKIIDGYLQCIYEG